MYALQKLAPRAVQLARLPVRNNTQMVVSPPINKVSATEKIVHCAILYAGILGFPFYIATNMKHYVPDQ